MISYEYGYSVYRREIGEMPEYKSLVIIDEFFNDESLEQSFQRMKEFVSKKEDIMVVDDKNLTVRTLDNLYTLALDKTFDAKDNLIVKQGNIIRHIMSQDFTRDCLYIDENGQTVDLTGRAKKDIGKSILTCQFNPRLNYLTNPRILSQYLDSKFFGRERIDDNLSDLVYRESPRYYFEDKALIERIFVNNGEKFIMLLRENLELNSYFYRFNGLSYSPYFNERQELPKQQAGIYNNLKHKGFKHQNEKPVGGDLIFKLRFAGVEHIDENMPPPAPEPAIKPDNFKVLGEEDYDDDFDFNMDEED